jgi:CPA2 family monovalent cation:H+ antiporter-2
VHHVAEAPVALGGALPVCGLLTWADVPIGTPTIQLFALAAVVIGPHPPGFDLVDSPTAEPPRARLAGTRRRRSLGREGTCRSPT